MSEPYSSADPIRVLIADDHPAVRAGLAAVVLAEADLAVAAHAENGEQAVALYREHRPQVVLMDLRMPVLGGVEGTRRIVAEFPDARVLALTTYQGDADVRRALDAGARGYLLKHMLMTEVIAAIRAVHRGEWVIPPAIAASLASHPEREQLTPRELEVLEWMVQGLSNKEIASAIGRTEETAKIHLKSIFAKLKVATRTEAVRVAVGRGLVHLD
ncbi:MAG TPA: response regulator transcription factor [Gemmatimonadales bacterium]|nr:response regulator transcription factor [Gemmatimonadales bacterium]